jgi:hypothetical protein
LHILPLPSACLSCYSPGVNLFVDDCSMVAVAVSYN